MIYILAQMIHSCKKGTVASMEIITKLASSPHILQHMNAAKYGFSEGICGEIPRFFAPWGQKWLPQQTRGSSQGCRILKCDTPLKLPSKPFGAAVCCIADTAYRLFILQLLTSRKNGL